jgi:hypothetical protein
VVIIEPDLFDIAKNRSDLVRILFCDCLWALHQLRDHADVRNGLFRAYVAVKEDVRNEIVDEF